jgi:hypothetical protein
MEGAKIIMRPQKIGREYRNDGRKCLARKGKAKGRKLGGQGNKGIFHLANGKGSATDGKGRGGKAAVGRKKTSSRLG